MAPRPPEPYEMFAERLSRALASGETVVRFGQNHFSHAICVEDGVFRVRRLETNDEDARAFLDKHGYFMPENAEDLARPRTLVFEAHDRDDLDAFVRSRWPF